MLISGDPPNPLSLWALLVPPFSPVFLQSTEELLLLSVGVALCGGVDISPIAAGRGGGRAVLGGIQPVELNHPSKKWIFPCSEMFNKKQGGGRPEL